MAWGISTNFGTSRQPPRRLTLEELLEQWGQQQPEAAPAPKPYGSVRDLPDAERRDARLNSLWSGLASLGSGISSGQVSRGLQGGLQDIQGIEGQAVAQGNQRQQAEYEQQQVTAQRTAADAQQKNKAAAIVGMFDSVTEGEEPTSPFAQRAEEAARRGDMSALAKQREEKPTRDAARARGWNPDAWDTIEKLNADLKGEIERANAAKAWEGEQQRLKEKKALENEAELAQHEELRKRKLGTYKPNEYESPEHAAAVTEAQERVRAKYRPKEAGPGGLRAQWREAADGRWGMLVDDGTPGGKWVPSAGQPQTYGNLVYTWANGVRWVSDKNDPTGTAYEAPMIHEGDPGYEKRPGAKRPQPVAPKAAPKPGAGPAAAAPPKITPETSLATVEAGVGRTLPPAVRAEVLKDLKAGRSPREVMADILRDNPSWKRK